MIEMTILKPVKIVVLLSLNLSLIMSSALFAAAAQNHSQASAPLRIARASGMSLDQAVKQVRKQTGGRILSAKTVSKKGQRTHRIKVLMPSGRVKIIHKPAG